MFEVIAVLSMFVFTIFSIMAIISLFKKNGKFKKYLKLTGIFFAIAFISIAISNPKSNDFKEKVQEKEVKKETITEDNKIKEKNGEKTIQKEKEPVKSGKTTPKNKESIIEKKEIKAFISKDEFNKKYKLDPEEKQYENSVFYLKDGSTLNADYLSYADDGLFKYAMVVFYEGKMMKIQMETKKTEKEIEQILGVDFKKIGAKVEPTPHGMEITFNEKFHDNNIKAYPFESSRIAEINKSTN